MRRPLFSGLLVLSLLSAAPTGYAEPVAEGDEEMLSGMSILGNDDAPKALVIVPWKSSELGDTLEVSRALDDGRRPDSRGRAVAGRSRVHLGQRRGF